MGADTEAIAFGTDGWRATRDEFTADRVRMVGEAVTRYLDDEDVDGSVAIGYDPRADSRFFAEELARVIAAKGRDVTVADRDCPTPVLAWTVGRDHAGGLMITASHNPPEYNGVKFVPGDGTPAPRAMTDAIEARLAVPDPATEFGTVTESDLIGPYVDHALSFVDVDLDGLSVVYDAMHGSGRGVTDRLLREAGATVERLRCERDPEFGGSAPEPVPERTGRLVELVGERSGIDLGVVNDGDADRLGIVTPERGFVDASVLLATLYDAVLDADPGAGDAVRTVSTSSLVDRVATARDCDVHQTPVGFKFVARAMADHGAAVGGEESGGYGIGAHLHNKDGVLVALRVAAAAAEIPLDRRIDALLETHGEIYQGRVSVDCPDDRKAAVVDELTGAVPDRLAGALVAGTNDVDGCKIRLVDDTWVLVRPSGTEPKLRVYAEADSEGRVSELLDAGRGLVESLR
ncbi:MAG: phosphoglucomutase/phosphomannomutase family protein [Salinirussus sp.]